MTKEKQLVLFDFENVKSDKDKELMNPNFRLKYYERNEVDRGTNWKNDMCFDGMKWMYE